MKLFAIFGNPVSHSVSPLMHNFAIKNFSLDACYTRYLLEDGEKLRECFFALNLSGVNVTVPHKEAAFKACDEVRGIAKEIEAVNTIVKEGDRLIGYNTDAPGFYESIKEFEAKKVLILGAGGTAKAISLYLRTKGFDVTILNRSRKRLSFFKDKGFKVFSWEDFEISSFDMIVNTTSAGLENDSFPVKEEILRELFKEASYCVDVIYNKNTPFLNLAEEFSLKKKDGKEMLLYQGVIAFEYFFSHSFSKEEITENMLKAFE